jgi:hypothetical protein
LLISTDGARAPTSGYDDDVGRVKNGDKLVGVRDCSRPIGITRIVTGPMESGHDPTGMSGVFSRSTSM